MVGPYSEPESESFLSEGWRCLFLLETVGSKKWALSDIYLTDLTEECRLDFLEDCSETKSSCLLLTLESDLWLL